MKKFKKLTAMILTAMLTLSMCATSVSATDVDANDEATVVKANEKIAVAVNEVATSDAKLTESAQVEVHKGDKVNLWIEFTLPENQADVSGWTIDMYYDDTILDKNISFADNNGFAIGTNAVDYALGLTDEVAELPGSGIAQCAFKDGGVISVADLNVAGFGFNGKTTKVVCVQLDAIADGTATISYKMRELVDTDFSEDSYLDLDTFQPKGGAEYALKYDVVCGHEEEVTDVTLRFAAPTSTTNRYNWNLKDVVFFYGSSTTFTNNTTIPMTATTEKYYTEETGVNTLISGGSGWTVYEVVVPKADIEAVEASKFVGFATSDGVNRTTLQSTSNILKAGVDTYTSYGSTAVSLSSLNEKTFVLKDSQWGANSAVSYVGCWLTDFNTIRFAAPFSLTKNSNWDDVEFFYSAKGGTFETATKLPMINTLETTKVRDTGSDRLKAGNWYIYAVSVDSTTATAIEAATNSGFAKPGASNKTAFSKNILTAKVDEFDGTYLSTAKTLDEVDGMVFVVQAPATATSLLAFNGEWQTEAKYTEGNDDLITIKFAAPIGTKASNDWNTGVELYYGNTNAYKNTERIAMTKTDETIAVSVDGTTLDTVVSGDWVVYEAKLTLEQVKAIDNSKAVGFIKAGSWNKTSINFYRSITRASKIEGVTKYNGVNESIETCDGLTFVISGEYDAAYETSTYLGSWVG